MWFIMSFKYFTFCLTFSLFWNFVKGQNYETCHFTTGAGSVICDCSNLGLTEITEPLRSDVTVLILRNNALQTISAEIFQNSNQLIKLDLSQNRLTSIRENTFSNLRSLQSLNISANGLVNLDSSALRNLQQLNTLALHDNRLSVMPNLNDLQNLQYLHLQGNALQDIISTDFQSLNNLRYLDISRNQIRTIEIQVFGNMADLVHLNMSFNEIRLLQTATFVGQLNLEELDLAYNSISSCDLSMFDGLSVPKISTLNLTGNSLNTLPLELFTRLKSLGVFEVADNNIELWKKSFFHDASVLEVLNLAGNGISTLDQSMFSRQPNLRVLDLSRNRLEDLNESLLDIVNLEILDLSSNNIRMLPSTLLSGPLQLREIRLSANLLDYTPAFTDYSNLEVISLNGNSIYGVYDGEFDQLRKLSELDLSNNYIQEIQVNAFVQATSLTFLNLQANKLTSLPAGLFTNLQRLMNLDLRRNPWECDCELFDFLQYAPNLLELIASPEVTCQTPLSLIGQPIETAIYCRDLGLIIALSVILPLIALIVFGILLKCYIVKRKDEKYSVRPASLQSTVPLSPSNFARTLPMPPQEQQDPETLPYYLTVTTLRAETANQYATVDGRRQNPEVLQNTQSGIDGYLSPSAPDSSPYTHMANLYLQPNVIRTHEGLMKTEKMKKPMPDIEGNYLTQTAN